ncbi:MAG TPA: PIN domain-containing protein [Candidatus Kapabacteria bacterium]|nr:PIN domain-containing protein [Candidatus Kapabacteria bacterium]
MIEIFADTGHWVALLIPEDQLHEAALSFGPKISEDKRVVTSELVLIELLNYVSAIDPSYRLDAAKIWTWLDSAPSVIIVPTSGDLLKQARTLYEKFSDKKWSLTDCASFTIMRDRKIHDALTHDHHFEQAGFRALLR